MATDTTVGAPKRKLKPARKQVEIDEIDRSEKVQPGKEYSKSRHFLPQRCAMLKGPRCLVQQVGWRRQRGRFSKVSRLRSTGVESKFVSRGTKLTLCLSKTLSQSRCVISRDAGYTRADASGEKYCCLFFARGCCPYGYVASH